MTEVRLNADSIPTGSVAIAVPLAALMVRAAAMGVLAGGPVTDLDPASVRRLLHGLQEHGIGAEAGIVLAPLTAQSTQRLDPPTERRMVAGLLRLSAALEASAAPSAEWPAMREVFGDEALVQLVGVGLSSMRRYAAGERHTPDDVADRLHWLAMAVADLAGAYNAFGVRRWFERPRAQLGGKSPRQLLGPDWSPNEARARRVRELASTLSGAGAMAT